MIATVEKTVAARFPTLVGKRVLVAASGGADSTALALALKELGCGIGLAHVHHGIRGQAADGDARFVKALAKKLGAPFFLGTFDVPGEAKRSGESLEMAARRLRRDFLEETARREGYGYVATGHTADDQAETILMRIARGTGIGGLAGIPYAAKRGGATFVRPLRDATRGQVVAYLEGRGQGWREDESNAEDFALRNRVRGEILPLLERRLNPAVRQALLRLGEIAAAEDEVMSALARKAAGGAEKELPLAIRRRVALEELRRRGVPPGEVDFAAVEDFSAGGNEGGGFPWRGKKFSMLWKNGEKSFHGVENAEAAPGLSIRAGRGFSRRGDETCLSAAAVGGRDLVLRSWRAGDRMEPLGMGGSKKLSDVFTDLKVPRGERNGWVVVECGGVVAALGGWRVARGFAVEGPGARSWRISGFGAGG